MDIRAFFQSKDQKSHCGGSTHFKNSTQAITENHGIDSDMIQKQDQSQILSSSFRRSSKTLVKAPPKPESQISPKKKAGNKRSKNMSHHLDDDHKLDHDLMNIDASELDMRADNDDILALKKLEDETRRAEEIVNDADEDKNYSNDCLKALSGQKRKSVLVSDEEEEKTSPEQISLVQKSPKKSTRGRSAKSGNESESGKNSEASSTPKKGARRYSTHTIESSDIELASSPSTPHKRQKKQAIQDAALNLDEIETTNVDDILVGEKKPFNYFQAMSRHQAEPLHPGSLHVPEGKTNCLVGFSFVFTGEFNELGREDIIDLAKRYGGKVVTAPSKRTSFVIVGENPGPSKIEKIKLLDLKVLNENQFYKLVESQPAKSDEGIPIADIIEESKPVAKAAISNLPRSEGITPSSSMHASVIHDEPDEDYNRPDIQSSTSCNDLWTTKYMPNDISEIIGNQGNILKLRQWLQDWKRRKVPFERAVLISGPPGIGKTTAAQVVSRGEGFKVLEYNASDARSKKALHDTIQEMLSNRSMAEYHGGIFFKPIKEKLTKNGKPKAPVLKAPPAAERAAVIMDEVDGMSSGDRGGIAELILLIKKTKVPIICICNDRASPKVRSLANYCMDLRFRRPDARQILPRLQYICQKENLHLAPNIVEQLVASTHGDIRQILNCLSNWSINKTSLTYDEAKSFSTSCKKDMEKGIFDIVADLLSRASLSRLSINEQLEFYFTDSSLVPLMIQENYISCKPSTAVNANKSKADLLALEALALASDALASSDVVDRKIHGANQEWSLAPLHGIFSCVIPAYHAAGSLGGRIDFASWLGQNSKSGKLQRLLTELSIHMCLHISGGKSDLRSSYVSPLIERLTFPLIKDGLHGVDSVIAILDDYTLLKEDYDAILELGLGRLDSADLLSKIPTNVKSALTRTYNKESHALPYASSTATKKAATANLASEETELIDISEEPEVIDEIDSGDLSKDKMIKSKITSSTATMKKSSVHAKKVPLVRKNVPLPKHSAAGKHQANVDSYDEGDGFVVDDDVIDHPKRRKK